MARTAKPTTRRPAARKPQAKVKTEWTLAQADDPIGEQFAQISLWSLKNRIEGRFPLHAKILFEPIAIDADGRHYLGHVRWATLRLSCEGFHEPADAPRYRRVLEKNEATLHVERLATEKTTFNLLATVKMKLGWGPASAEVGVGGGRSRESRDKQAMKAQLDMALIEELPRMGWRLGDREVGDITKPGGFLDGPYVNDVLTHLDFAPGKGERRVTARLSISLKQGALHVAPLGGYRDEAKLPSDAVVEAFKERLRSLKLATAMDFDEIARATLRLTPATDDDL